MGFNFFGAFIPYYGLCIVIGLVCAASLGLFLCHKKNLDVNNFIIICSYLIAFGFLGAKILYIIVSIKLINFKEVFSSFKAFNEFISSGFVFYGGLLGGFVALIFVKKVHSIDIKDYLQILAPSVALAHAFGRIGCSLAGCCYGKVTSSCFCYIYKNSIAAPNNVRLVPVQGIESAFLFIFAILFTILNLKKVKINIFILYVFLYSILRFVLEFFRGDIERGIFMSLSTSQIISAFLFICVIVYFIKNLKAKVNISILK